MVGSGHSGVESDKDDKKNPSSNVTLAETLRMGGREFRWGIVKHFYMVNTVVALV